MNRCRAHPFLPGDRATKFGPERGCLEAVSRNKERLIIGNIGLGNDIAKFGIDYL
jgi:hypothetical protein